MSIALLITVVYKLLKTDYRYTSRMFLDFWYFHQNAFMGTKFKGIVSRDCAGLQMSSVDRSEFCMRLRFIFNLKLILNSNYFKMASVWVHCRPRFPLGGGFSAEQFAPAWWYETAGGEERLLRRVAQQNEAPPAEF
jgi:hypothetical protein